MAGGFIDRMLSHKNANRGLFLALAGFLLRRYLACADIKSDQRHVCRVKKSFWYLERLGKAWSLLGLALLRNEAAGGTA